MAQRNTPTTTPPPPTTIRGRPPEWHARCYFDSSPTSCAYGIRCRFGHEGDVYTDAPGAVQQFKDGYNVAAPASAVKGGLRRAAPNGGLNGGGARGRGGRHAPGGKVRVTVAAHGGSSRIAASTGPPEERSGVADSARLCGRDAGSPEQAGVASTDFPPRRGRGRTRGSRGGPVTRPQSSRTSGIATRAAQQGSLTQNMPDHQMQTSHHFSQQQQQQPLPPAPPEGSAVVPPPHHHQQDGGGGNQTVLPAPQQQGQQYYYPPPHQLQPLPQQQPFPPHQYHTLASPPLPQFFWGHQQLFPPLRVHPPPPPPPPPPQLLQVQQQALHQYPPPPLQFHPPPPPPPPPKPVFPGLPIGSSPYFSQTSPYTAPGVIFAAARGLLFYYGVDGALYAYDPAQYPVYASHGHGWEVPYEDWSNGRAG